MTSKLEYALYLAERGFYVFRIKKNGKKPFATGWQDEATCNANAVRELFQGHDYNIGIFTGKYFQFSGNEQMDRALAVVDVDTKEDKKGNQTMQEMDALGYDFPATLTVTTASGGRHLIYAVDTPISGGANKVGQHVDLKSHGGYIVGEGSTIDGIPYRIANDDNWPTPAECPEWLIKRAGFPMAPSAMADIPNASLDSDQAIQRATAYLTGPAPIAISGAGGNDTTFKVAAILKDFGISQALCEDLMWKHYNPRCAPPWPHDQLFPIIANAYHYSDNPAGILSPNNEFEPVALDPKEEEAEKRAGIYYEWCENINTDNEYYPLIEDIIDQGTMSVIYGDSNTGKTFIAMDMAFHIAIDLPWDNKRVTQGSVLYIAAEGGRGAMNRITALKQKHNAPTAPFALVPCPVNLFDRPKDVKTIIKLIQQAEAEKGPLRLIVVDTLARAMSHGNENAAEDMNRFVENCDAIRSVTKAHVMIVHHSGKDASKGARGSSVLRAATDTELEVANSTVTIKKQRDMEFAKPIGFDLEKVDLGTNAYGRAITSCTVNIVDIDTRADYQTEHRLEHRDLIALMAIQQCKTARSLRNSNHVVDQKTWGECCKHFDITMVPGAKPWPKSDNSFFKAFTRCRDRLVAFGKVEEIEDKQWGIVESGQGVQ